jgi:nitronate monooxygenase
MGTGARWAIEQFPDAAIAERLLSRYFKPEGRGGKPYRNLHKRIIDPRTDRQREGLADLQELAVVSAFAEVMRAKHHHDGVVGINVLRKIAMPIPATIYGAMLAGVDVVLMGAAARTRCHACSTRSRATTRASCP